MIKRISEFTTEVRTGMRGGDGSIQIDHIWKQVPGELGSPTRMFAKLTIKPGCSIGNHAHDGEEEIFYILKGVAEINDNGKSETLNAGDSCITGGGKSHAVRNTGSSDLELLAVIIRYEK